MKLIVGLGNPGKKYQRNRHNVGFRVVEMLAQRWSLGLDRHKYQARFASGIVGEEKVALLQPQTFMNRSGATVSQAVRFYGTPLCDLMIILDDMALPFGRLRIRPEGSAGGHNGLQDIIDSLGDNGFNRLRVGIGSPAGPEAIGHVLGDFCPDEEGAIADVLPRAADAVACWLTTGIDEAMNRYNKRLPDDRPTQTDNPHEGDG